MAIKNRLEQLIREKQVEWACNITYKSIANATGLAESTIARLKSPDSKGVRYDVLDRLCAFLDCQVGDILVYVSDDTPSQSATE